MRFCIADTFTDSLSRLTGIEQRAVKTAAFDLQINPTQPSMQFHRIERSKDPDFWSVRVNKDIRLIVHKTGSSLLLCYVGHHDDAYAWAERRRIEMHPKTGAAQLVEIRERVEEVAVRRVSSAAPEAPPPEAPLFARVPDDVLLSCGVPADWLDDVKNATDSSLFEVLEHLPQEAAEALMELATGATPQVVGAGAVNAADPFGHPDAQRRFRVMTNVEELAQALEYPWEKWTVFLHPAQRHLVERGYGGPVRVSGSAGTGKTIVALHRAVHLARTRPNARILVTTFSKALANALKTKLQRLAGNQVDVMARVAIHPITGIGYDLYAQVFGAPNMAKEELIRTLLTEAASRNGAHAFTSRFLYGEWSEVVDPWQLRSWEDYRDVARLGRKTRIGGKQREALWALFEQVRAELDRRKLVTWCDVFTRLAEHFAREERPPFDCAVVDEAQDIGVAELRFLAALGGGRPDSLFFTGDLGQRIFQQPFSWKALGVDVRGRSHTLRINYRTSHQIRSQADRLLPQSLADVDGNVESRRGTMSVFNGPSPTVAVFETPAAETKAVGEWIAARLKEGVQAHEIGVFVRDHPQRERAKAAVKAAGAKVVELGEKVETAVGKVAVGTMHLAKGLEFRAVAVMACDDEVLPLQERIENVPDDSDLEEVYNTERHLLYVACTRARDFLLVSGVKPGSEFLGDLAD